MGTLLYQSIADDIEQLILHKEYKDGDCLPSERVLATQYGVSRNVIREYLELAIGRHIMEQESVPDLTRLYDIYGQMNDALNQPEQFVKLDTLFHLNLAELARNLPLRVFYMTLNNLISKSIYYGEGNTSYGRITAQQEHEQILLSLKNRDMDAYKTAIHLHLELIRQLLQ